MGSKWRAVITNGEGVPSQYCIDVNTHALARYAALCQEGGLVPIVGPEGLIEATTPSTAATTSPTATLQAVFDELHRQRVNFEHMILKPFSAVTFPGEVVSCA